MNRPRFEEGETRESTNSGYLWTCVLPEPDDDGRTVWKLTLKNRHDHTRYVVVDWQPR